MPSLTCCPEPAALARLTSGELPAAHLEPLLAHLEACPACSTLLGALAENDTLVELLRQARPADLAPPSPQVAALIARLSQVRPEAGAAPVEDAAPAADGEGETVTEVLPADSPADRYPFLAPPQAADELGRLGPYRVLAVLGTGGMGVVFRAEDPQLDRQVALKVMLPGLAASEAARHRFLREARAGAALRHDHIVTIYQVGEDRGVPYLAMELLDGESLDRRLHRDGRLPAAEIVRIGREMALGLAAAHRRGLIHRDIKPANVWLEAETGRVKILDFGLARAFGQETQLTHQGAIVGTPAYMAPEQAQGRAVDPRADLFSLGCVLYRLAAGQVPFLGTDLISTLLAVSTQDPPPPRQLNPSLPADLSDLVLSLLAKDPEQRPPSAQAVVEALDRLTLQPAAARHRPRRRLVAAAAVGALLTVLTGLWAGGGLRLTTKDGTIVLEDLPADAKVQVDGETVTLEPGGAGQPIEVRAAPGERRLVITAAGFEIQTQDVVLRAGQRKPIRLRLEPLATAEKPGTASAFEEVHGATRTALLAWAATLPRGFRPRWVSARTGTRETLFDAVATRDPAAKDWRLRILPPEEAASDYEELKDRGFRPALICTYRTDETGDARIWVKDGRPWANWFGTAEFMHDIAREAHAKGDPPSSLCVKALGSALTYEMTFDGARQTPFEMHLDLSPEELERKTTDYRKKGWRPHLVNLHHNRSPLRYLAVFVENRTKQTWRFTPGLTPAAYEAELARCRTGGGQPRCVCSYVAEGKVGYTVVWDDSPSRLAAFLRGNWRIAGDVIEHPDRNRSALLLFGAPEFGDGDFTCEAMRSEGDHGLALVARASDLENYYYFDVGVFKNTYHSLYAKEAGTTWRRLDQNRAPPVPDRRWIKLRLRLRGDRFEGYLDEQRVVSGRDDRRLHGYLGLRTWNEAGRYRNLRFTDPAGKVLWQGLPELPAAPPAAGT